MIVSAKVGTNADIFPDVLELYAPAGSKIVDLTYGKGVFWKNVDKSKYNLVTNDLVTEADHHCDFRNTPFPDNDFDMAILDPPYMHSSGSIKESIASCYANNTSVRLRNQKEVRQLYFDGIAEARRILKKGGILAIKCQDMIESGKQNWNHVQFMNAEGFECEDLFVLVQSTIPARDPKWSKQYHARRNHSFFVILRKK